MSVMVLWLKYREGYVHVLEQSLKCISQSSSFSNVYGYSNSLFLSWISQALCSTYAMVSLLYFNIGGCLFAELNLAVWLPINPLLLHQIIQLYNSQILCRNGYYINASLCGMYLLHIYLLLLHLNLY